MKKIYSLIVVTIAVLASALSLSAQKKERMIIYSKIGEPMGMWVDHTDSIMFLTEEVDLGVSMTTSPIEGVTGVVKLAVNVGKDVVKLCMAFPEKYQIPAEGISDVDLLQMISRMPAENVHSVPMSDPSKRSTSFDLTGMQQGYSYLGLVYGVDKYGCPGPITRVPFDVAKGPLKGNPQVNVGVLQTTTTQITLKFTPNQDCAGYYYLVTMKNDPNIAEMMKNFRIPDMKHYVVAFGGDFQTRKAYVGEQTQDIRGLRPGREYVVNVVMIDADGQMSDVIETAASTQKMGTSQTSTIAVTAENITSTKATIKCKPDANTSEYRFFVMEKAKYTEEFALDYIKNSPDGLMELPYEIGDKEHTWESLTPNTSYYAIAMGLNADGVWGTLTKVEFQTKP